MKLSAVLCVVLLAATVLATAQDVKHSSKKAAAKEHHFSIVKEARSVEGFDDGYYGYDGYVPTPGPPPPDTWTCRDSYYGTLDGCDCNCGAYDPDCNVDGQFVFGCFPEANEQAICVEPGVCQFIEVEVPAAWTCNPSYYDTNDGCDCNCGILDPDCLESEQFIFGCNAGVNPTCVSPGVCEYESEVPAGWLCSASYYGTADGCDCNCGIVDPDCSLAEDDGGVLLNCPCEGMTCAANGYCTGVCGNFFISATPVGDSTAAPVTQCDPVIIYRDDDGAATVSIVDYVTESCDCEAVYIQRENSDTSNGATALAGGLLALAGAALVL